jgi:hypothetical protein
MSLLATILTPEGDGFWFWLWLLSSFLTLLTHKLHGFLEVIGLRWEFGWILGCVKLVAKVVGLWCERVLGCFWKWDLDVSDHLKLGVRLNTLLVHTFPTVLSHFLTQLLKTQTTTIRSLKLLNHDFQLRFLPRQPTQHHPQIVILLIDDIQTGSKFKIAQSNFITASACIDNMRVLIVE